MICEVFGCFQNKVKKMKSTSGPSHNEEEPYIPLQMKSFRWQTDTNSKQRKNYTQYSINRNTLMYIRGENYAQIFVMIFHFRAS